MPGSAPAMIGPLFDTAERAQLSDLLDAPGLSCPVRGAAWPDGEQARSLKRTSHRWLPRSGQDRRQASSASDGCAGSPA